MKTWLIKATESLFEPLVIVLNSWSTTSSQHAHLEDDCKEDGHFIIVNLLVKR